MDGEEESTLLEDSVSPAKATFMQHQSNRPGHASEGSVALPAVMRAGGSGKTPFGLFLFRAHCRNTGFPTLTSSPVHLQPGHQGQVSWLCLAQNVSFMMLILGSQGLHSMLNE